MIAARLEGVFSKRAEPVFTVLTSAVPTPQGLIAFFTTGANQVIHDGTSFVTPYTRSTREAVMGGYEYTVRRDGEWYAPVDFIVQRMDVEVIDSLVTRVSPNDVVTFSVTEYTEQSVVVAVHADGSKELIFDGYNFTFFYQGVSTYEFTDDDPDFVHEFSLRRVGGWPVGALSFAAYSTGIVEPVAPTITSTPPSFAGLENGDAFPAYTVTATGYPAPTFTTSTLPTGITFDGTTFGGSFASFGTYEITITATNGVSPDDTQVLNITVASSYSPLDLSPRLWLDAANFSGGTWEDSSGNGFDFTGTATASTDGTESYPAVSFNGTSNVLSGPSWHTIFGSGSGSDPTEDWQLVVCFRPSSLATNIEGIRASQRASVDIPQVFGCTLRGVALMRSATRTHIDGKEATRRPRVAMWERSTLGDLYHKFFATPIKENQTQIIRVGRSGEETHAAGYKNATFVGCQDNCTVGGSETCVIGGSAASYYAGKISHIFAFDRKLTDAETATLADWVDTQVGVAHTPKTLDGEVDATTLKVDMDAADAVGINGDVVDLDVGLAWDIGEGGHPIPAVGWELYYPAQRPALITTLGHSALEFTITNGDHAFPILSTAGTYPSGYAKLSSLFGAEEGYACCVVRLDTFAVGGTTYSDWPSIVGWLSLPTKNRGLQYKKIAGVPTVMWYDAEQTVPEATLCFVEFGFKTVSGNSVAHIRVNNGAVVKYTHTGLISLGTGDVVSFGVRDTPPTAKHTLFTFYSCVDAQGATAQNKWRDELATRFGLTLATTDLFA